MSSFQDNLKKIRKDNNLSQEQLAEDLGVSRQAISKWESGVAYPEMDKIISLCDKFDINIDDLLHSDIREVKGEEITKKNIKRHIDSFLNFITDTINLIINMDFRSKMKCLIEQVIICAVLAFITMIVGDVLENIVYNILSYIPDKPQTIIINILSSIYLIFMTITSICIVIYIFKTRYLDYYVKVKKEPKESDKEEPITFKKTDDKIIIRDPKHSEYSFVNVLFKILVFGIKAFFTFILFFLCGLLIALTASLIISFLIIKSGLLFIGILLSIVSSIVITSVIILFLFNFIFNRKSNKKIMILTFIVSLIIFGCGVGTIFTASLDYDVVVGSKNEASKTDIYKLDMNNNLFIDNKDYIYIEKNIDNIEIEYTIDKECDINYYDENNGVYLYANCSNPSKIIKQIIKGVNNKKITIINDQVSDLKVYASKKNIEKMKTNYKNHIEKIEKERNQYEMYENIISEKDKEIENLQERLYKYEQ